MPRATIASKARRSKPTANPARRRKSPATGALVRNVSIVDAATMQWRATGKEGLSLKTVREDQSKGLFLGEVGFEPMMRSGLHQHQGVATSYFARGGLTDYHGSTVQHEVGINLKGATHDAIAYESTLLIARLEGPVTYPESAGDLHNLHSGAHHGQIANPHPECPPDVSVPVNSVAAFDTGVGGVSRRTLFDYAGVGDNHRMLLWSMLPGSVVPVFRTTALLEMWVHGGDLSVNGKAAHADCFIVIEPGQEVALNSHFGARVFVWVQGPAESVELNEPDRLFGY